MPTSPRVGFVGLGGMGSRMARNIMRAGYRVTVYNRTPAHADDLKRNGATVVPSVRAVAEASDVVITMLSDPDAVRAVVTGPDGLLVGARPGLVHIDMSTVGPADARALVATETPYHVQVLHAPVLGSLGPAERGELIILVGGDRAVADAQTPLLQTMGKTIHYLGANTHACAMKLALNLLLAGSLQLFGEAMALVTGWGVTHEQALGIMTDSPATSPALKARAATMFDPHASNDFALHLGRKDLRLAIDAAYEQTAALPMTATALETFTMAMRDHGDEDIGRIAAFIIALSAQP